MLLIVGDGIRESVEDMVEYLSKSPQLYFTLALVELQVYHLNKDENSLIVIPQIITRTKEITRAIVKITGASSSDVSVDIETDLGTEAVKPNSNGSRRLTITTEDFFEQLARNNNDYIDFAQQIIKDCEKRGYHIDWNTSSFGVKFFDPMGSGIKISLFTVDKYGNVYLGYSQGQMEKLGISMDLSYAFAKDTAALLPGIEQNPDKKYSWTKYSTLKDLKAVYVNFMARLAQYVIEIEQAVALQEK